VSEAFYILEASGFGAIWTPRGEHAYSASPIQYLSLERIKSTATRCRKANSSLKF